MLQLRDNEISYTWDRIIERFNEHIIGGTLYCAPGEGYAYLDKSLWFLARESRLRRKVLSKALVGLLESTKGFGNARLVIPTVAGDPYYVFLILSSDKYESEADYRIARREVLHAYIGTVKILNPDAEDIVGFATETAKFDSRSEDVIYADVREWTTEMQADAEAKRDYYNCFKTVVKREFSDHEYPDPARYENAVSISFGGPTRSTKYPRNEKCHCGSGLKYKNCHLRKDGQ